MQKLCPTCKQAKPLCDFYKNKAKQDGLYVQCKLCHNDQVRVYRDSNPDVMRRAYAKRGARYSGSMHDVYIKKLLGVESPPQELVSLKRESLFVKRLKSDLRKAINESSKDFDGIS